MLHFAKCNLNSQISAGAYLERCVAGIGVDGCLDPREVGGKRGGEPDCATGGSGKEGQFFGPWPWLRLA